MREKALERDHYLCQACYRKGSIQSADVVHHKKPLLDYWSLRLTLSNLESLCHECHNNEDTEKEKSDKNFMTRGGYKFHLKNTKTEGGSTLYEKSSFFTAKGVFCKNFVALPQFCRIASKK